MRQHSHKVLNKQTLKYLVQHPRDPHLKFKSVKVLHVRLVLVSEHGVDDPVPQRVDPQLRDVEDVLPDKVAFPSLVKLHEPVVEAADLAEAEACLITRTESCW